MAYPFRPVKKVRSKKLTRERENFNLTVTVFNRPVEFKTHHGESRRNQNRSTQELNHCNHH